MEKYVDYKQDLLSIEGSKNKWFWFSDFLIYLLFIAGGEKLRHQVGSID